jgi:hypothetical protein
MTQSISQTEPVNLSWEDKAEIRVLVEQYFHGLDHGRPAIVADAFSESCYLKISISPPMIMNGRAEVATAFAGSAGFFAASIHALSHHRVDVDGDVITGTTYAIAHLVMLPGQDDKMQVRGLRYDDIYVREAGVWRIGRRIHNPLWQYEAPAVPLGL